MKNLAVHSSRTRPENYSGDLLVYLVTKIEEGSAFDLGGEVGAMASRVSASGDFSGKEGEHLIFYPENGRPGRIMVVGLGKDEPSRELFRKAGGTVATLAGKTRAKDLLLVLPELLFPRDEMGEALTEGLILGAYRFRKYKTGADQDDKEGRLMKAVIHGGGDKTLAGAVKTGMIAAQAACLARDMANEPANLWTAGHFADYGRKLAKECGLSCTVLGKTAMKKLGMGGIIAVNQGTAGDPALVILEYRAGKKVPTLLLVGKGLTFDSGGLSLKPGAGMEEMKYDMCGGAAVLGAMRAIAMAGLKNLNVVVMVPATENLPGPGALKPGDVITQYGGKTVEVVNTDAEGRLILADALAYGIKKYKPAMVIDVATLTGAVIVGLGHHRTGLLANSDLLCEALLAAGKRSGEPLWRLPLGKEYSKQLKSEIADLKNVGKRDGGTITAAAFLQEFVGDIPWAHLDIAGTAWDFTEKSYVPKGPSGTAVRTIFDFVRNWR